MFLQKGKLEKARGKHILNSPLFNAETKKLSKSPKACAGNLGVVEAGHGYAGE